jgi:hypothetical protein
METWWLKENIVTDAFIKMKYILKSLIKPPKKSSVKSLLSSIPNLKDKSLAKLIFSKKKDYTI